jgi:hypothetical protein
MVSAAIRWRDRNRKTCGEAKTLDLPRAISAHMIRQKSVARDIPCTSVWDFSLNFELMAVE